MRSQLANFLRGFADTSGVSLSEAHVAWADFSRSLSATARESLENQGYFAGRWEGIQFRKVFMEIRIGKRLFRKAGLL